LTILVIVHHTAIAYGASGGWCYITPEIIKGPGIIALSSMLAVDQAFFMSLFFFISALFTPSSVDRKGVGKFLTDRLFRLGIPLLLTMFVINPSLLYGIAVYTQATSQGWFDYITAFISRGLTASHMWFVLALLIFELLYLLLGNVAIFKPNYFSGKLPSNRQVLGFLVVCTILAFVIRLVYPIGGKNFVGLQFGYFGLYMVFYALGIIASRNNWLNQLSVKRARKWGIAAVAAIPLIVLAWISLLANPSLFGEFVGGFHWRSFALSAWEAVVCTGLCYFFLSWFKNKLNTSTSFWGQMAANSYSVYFIHPVIVVGFTILLEQFSLIPEIKFLLACGLSVVVCFVVSHLLRKIPGVKRVL
jgi:hypothetical protein